MKAPLLALLLGMALIPATGCNRDAPPAPSTPPVPAQAAANVLFEDIEGKPVQGITPIAVVEPNAFDQPVAKGSESGPDGRASITLPTDRRLFVRGWDAGERYFTNSFSETTPGRMPDDMRIMMAPGAAADVLVQMPDGAPAANIAVSVMLVHPTQGPWWPARGATRPDGMLHFRSIPPGRFAMQFTTDDGYSGQIPDAVLQPASQNDLGAVKLQPKP